MPLAPTLASILASAKTEHPVLSWLKTQPLILSHSLTFVPFGRYVAAEFPFGTDFRADFVVLSPFSGGWDVHFVELEPPNVTLFTRGGKPARRLADAVAQIDAWKTFIEKNRSCVLRDLSKFIQKRELVWGERDEPTDNGGWPLYHPRSWLNWYFDIVIGRSGALSDDQIEKKASFRMHHDVEVMTYDRLLKAAEKLDSADSRRA